MKPEKENTLHDIHVPLVTKYTEKHAKYQRTLGLKI